ncbi:hypothetical protein MMC13_003637 [Lambiella insularis]|nr:hypothetical protein [Lambiella insularis]
MSQAEVSSTTDHSSMEKRNSTHVEEAGMPQRRTFGQKLKAHLKKWWWLHAIIFIALLLLIILLLVYVGFPRIAQSEINNSTLNITSVDISNPTETSFVLAQDSFIINDSAYHPQLDAFNASLALQGEAPYAYVTIPALHATATAESDLQQTVQITNLTAFTAFTTALLGNDMVNMEVHGSTGLHEMAFPATTVDYDKIMPLTGMSSLSGFNVTSFQILLIPLANGTNMVGDVLIPNPSVFTFAMGNVTMNLFVAGAYIGNSTIDNLVIAPGNNTYPMSSITNQTAVILAITETYKDGMLPVDIVGSSSVYDGVHLTYYEKALSSLTQHVTLNVGAALKAIGVTIP